MKQKSEFILQTLESIADTKGKKKATVREELAKIVESVDALIPQSEAEEMELKKFGFYPAEECIPFVTNQKKPFYHLDSMSLVPNGDTANLLHYGDWAFRQLEALYHMPRMNSAEAHLWLKDNLFRDRVDARKKKNEYKSKFRGMERTDWKKIQIEWMKYCLNLKFRDNSFYRRDLAATKDKLPVEDATDTNYASNLFWGAKLVELNGKKYYFGCNVLGKLHKMMRENGGKLPYELPADLHIFGQPILPL